MNQNLMWTLSRKYPNANSFEEAVAMEVEAIEKDKQAVEDQLNELANKESALRMRVRELDFAKEQLGIRPQHPVIAAVELKPAPVASPPVAIETTTAPPLFQVDSRLPRDRRARRRMRKGTDLVERRYMNSKYVDMARKRGVGTVESHLIVWLTVDEHGPVYEDVRASRAAAPVLQADNPPQPEMVWNRNSGRGSQQTRTRKGTNELERSYSGHDYVNYARVHGKGSPGIGCVWLTASEAESAVDFKNNRPRESAAK